MIASRSTLAESGPWARIGTERAGSSATAVPFHTVASVGSADVPPRTSVRIFVSSTFRDMSEEREQLVKHAYPQLRRFCDERNVELTMVDLRWGITREDAEVGRVVPLCLREIDRCRPYFVALLGGHYGWIPVEIDAATLAEFPWVRDHPGASLTELEIRHAVLNSLELAPDARFYLRDPSSGADEDDDRVSHDRLEALKATIRRAGLVSIDGYHSATEVAERIRLDFEAIIDRDCPRSAHLGQPGDRVATYQEMLGRPEGPRGVPIATLRRARLWNALFARRIRSGFVGRTEQIRRLDQFAVDPVSHLGIHGPHGIGKSALIARWAERAHSSVPIVTVHVDASSKGSPLVVEQLAFELEEILSLGHGRHGSVRAPVPLLQVLVKASESGGAILVVDGIEPGANADALREIARALPPRIRLVLTSRSAETLQAILPSEAAGIELSNLGLQEQRELIVATLARHGKALDSGQLDRILDQRSDTPLDLVTTLDELRAFGSFEELDRVIDAFARARDRATLYEAVLARLDVDFGGPDRSLVRDVFASLDCALGKALPEAELCEFLDVVPLRWTELHDALRHLLALHEGRLGFRDDELSKVVERRYLGSAAERTKLHARLADYYALHESASRRASALAHHLLHSQQWSRLRSALFDLEFLWRLDEAEWSRHWAALADRYDPDAEGLSAVESTRTHEDTRLWFGLFALGQRLRLIRAFRASEAALRRALEFQIRKEESGWARAGMLRELGLLLLETRRLDESAGVFVEAQTLSPSPWNLTWSAAVEQKRQRPVEAERLYRAALKACGEQDRELAAVVLRALTDLASAGGRYQEARELGREAVAASDDPTSRVALARALAREAGVLDDQDAVTRYREAVDVVLPVEEKSGPFVSELLADLGWLLLLLDEHQEAAEHLARAKGLAQRLGVCGEPLAKILRGEGYLAIRAGEPARALELFQQGIHELRGQESEYAELAATLQAGAGRAQTGVGLFKEAERSLLDALAAFEALHPSHQSISAVLQFLHRLYEKTSRLEEAERIRRRAVEAGALWAQSSDRLQ